MVATGRAGRLAREAAARVARASTDRAHEAAVAIVEHWTQEGLLLPVGRRISRGTDGRRLSARSDTDQGESEAGVSQGTTGSIVRSPGDVWVRAGDAAPACNAPAETVWLMQEDGEAMALDLDALGVSRRRAMVPFAVISHGELLGWVAVLTRALRGARSAWRLRCSAKKALPSEKVPTGLTSVVRSYRVAERAAAASAMRARAKADATSLVMERPGTRGRARGRAST